MGFWELRGQTDQFFGGHVLFLLVLLLSKVRMTLVYRALFLPHLLFDSLFCFRFPFLLLYWSLFHDSFALWWVCFNFVSYWFVFRFLLWFFFFFFWTSLVSVWWWLLKQMGGSELIYIYFVLLVPVLFMSLTIILFVLLVPVPFVSLIFCSFPFSCGYYTLLICSLVEDFWKPS